MRQTTFKCDRIHHKTNVSSAIIILVGQHSDIVNSPVSSQEKGPWSEIYLNEGLLVFF